MTSNGTTTLHRHMQRDFPKIGRCEFCATTTRPTENASAGHTYSRWRHDWFELCKRCHFAFDESPGAAKLRNKTHCPRGHEYTPENTKVYRGSRHCRICATRRGREYKRRRRAERRR